MVSSGSPRTEFVRERGAPRRIAKEPGGHWRNGDHGRNPFDRICPDDLAGTGMIAALVAAGVSRPSHSERRMRRTGWVLYLCNEQPRRLVVFVHGFRGGVSSWQRFPDASEAGSWWAESDLLFIAYQSERENITGVSHRLRRLLPEFYPRLDPGFLTLDGAAVREPATDPYEELFLVGHSLGGVIVRRLLCDVAEGWLDALSVEPATPRPSLLDAEVRLFSPASAGFRPGGTLGLLSAGPLWYVLNMHLRRSSAFSDLQPSSMILAETRLRTEAILSSEHGSELSALRARILWANPDDVVLTERYRTDLVDDSADGTTHSTVCKPRHPAYTRPWRFVEGTGRA